MTGWQLVPGEIEKTLAATSASLENLGTTLAAVASQSIEPVRAGAGFDGVVAGALAGFLEEQATGRLSTMMNRYAAGLQATAAATNAYLAGDEEMAASVVSSTENAAVTGDLTRFQGGR